MNAGTCKTISLHWTCVQGGKQRSQWWALEIFRKYDPFSHLPNGCQENEKGKDSRVTLSLGVSNSFVRTWTIVSAFPNHAKQLCTHQIARNYQTLLLQLNLTPMILSNNLVKQMTLVSTLSNKMVFKKLDCRRGVWCWKWWNWSYEWKMLKIGWLLRTGCCNWVIMEVLCAYSVVGWWSIVITCSLNAHLLAGFGKK